MDTESFKVLEYGKITNWLASFASTMCGKELCRSVIPSGDYDEVVRLHQETAEAVQVQQMQSPPFGGIYDLRTLLKKASMGSVLEMTLHHAENFDRFCHRLQMRDIQCEIAKEILYISHSPHGAHDRAQFIDFKDSTHRRF